MPLNPQISMSLGANVLIEGKLLSGSDLLDYAKHKGLCPKCLQHKTHKRIKKRLGILRSEANWVPVTLKDKEAGNYIVYKGYCLQPTCWTLVEAKARLGETPTIRSKSAGRTRMATPPAKERSSSSSVPRSDEDSVSVTPSEHTFFGSDGVSVGSFNDQAQRRNVTPGRRYEESRPFSPYRDVAGQGTADRATRYDGTREISVAFGSSNSIASPDNSTHSRDISLLGRQPSLCSITSERSEKSSHRRRFKNLGDIKIQESPRDMRPAMFYRQALDSSDNSDDDSAAILEQIVKTEEALRHQVTNDQSKATQRSSLRRKSIGTLIQAAPRLLNLLSDTRVESSDCDSTEEINALDSDREVNVYSGQASPAIENTSNARMVKGIQLGKGKSSSNIQNQQKRVFAIKRSLISKVSQPSNQKEARNGTSPNRASPESRIEPLVGTRSNFESEESELISPRNVSATRHVSKSPTDGRVERTNEAEKPATENRIQPGNFYVVKRRLSGSMGASHNNQNEERPNTTGTRRRASIGGLPQYPLKADALYVPNSSPPSCDLNHNRHTEMKQNSGSERQSANENRVPRCDTDVAKRRFNSTAGVRVMNRDERTYSATRRRSSITGANRIPLHETDVTKRRLSDTTEVRNINHDEKTNPEYRRRASITGTRPPNAIAHVWNGTNNSSSSLDLNRIRKTETTQKLEDGRDVVSPRRAACQHQEVSGRGASIPTPTSYYKRRICDDESDSKNHVAQSPIRTVLRPVVDYHLPSENKSAASFLTRENSPSSRRYSANVEDCDILNVQQVAMREQVTSRMTMRQNVSDILILRHLCHLLLDDTSISAVQGSTIKSEEYLWTNLHTRYEDVSNITSSKLRKISTIINVLDRTQDIGCNEKCWALLSYLTKHGVGDDEYSTVLKQQILQRACDEFDRQNFDYNAKLQAAVTMSLVIAEEKFVANKVAMIWSQTMTTTIRLKWISVLSDVINFRNFNSVEQRKGTSAVFDVVFYILVSDAINDKDDGNVYDRSRLMNRLFDISVSVLAAVCFDFENSMTTNDNLEYCHDTSSLCGAVLGLLAYVSSHTSFSVIEERHAECLNLIRLVMKSRTNERMVYQGILAVKRIMLQTDKSTKRDVNETNGKNVATNVAEIVHKALLFEQTNPDAQMLLETTGLITLLLEMNDPIRAVTNNSVIIQHPIAVDAVVRLVDTSNDIKHVEEGFFTLMCLVTKNHTSGMHLRQLNSIAPRLVLWLARYRDNALIQEFVCLTIEYLVATVDCSMGQEVGSCGGLKVLSEVLISSAKSKNTKLNQAASRALVGVLSVVDKQILIGYNTLVKNYVVDPMFWNVRSLNLQLSGLNILHCVCLRSDSIVGLQEIILPAVIKSMESHFGNASLLTTCCTIIRKIVAKLEDWSVIIETEALRAVVNSLLVHPSSTELVLEGMTTIKDLAGKKTFRPYFNSEDAEIAIVSIFPLHHKNPDVVSLVFGSLNNVAVNGTTGTVAPMQLDVLHFILSAISDFPQNHRVVRNACLLLKSYTYNEDNLKAIRSYSELVLESLTVCSSSPIVETRDRARYITRKL